LIRKCMIFYSLMLMLVNPAWGVDMDEATLRGILKKSDTTLIVYFMFSDALTRSPVTAERMRWGSYDCKLAISIKDSTIARQLAEIIIEAGEIDNDIDCGGFVRLLVDVISDGTIVYSLSSDYSYLNSGTDIKMLLEEIRKFAIQS